MNYKMLKKMALGLALVVTVTSVNVPAKAAEAPAFNKASVSVKVGQTKKLKVKNAEWKLKKAVSSDENVATAKVKGKKQLVKVTGVSTGNTTVVATFKKADKKQTVEVAVAVKDNVVTKAAKDYFINYKDRTIAAADVFQMIADGKEPFIIDIRRADDYANGHLKGAINLPYADIANYLNIIPDDVPVYLNCYSGQTASQTTALLNVAGKQAINIKGGWKKGIEVVETHADYVDTVAVPLPTKEYPVNAEIEKAIKAYYAEANTNTYTSFNFPVDKLVELIAAKDDTYTVVDIRSAADYAAGHIEVVELNIPFGTEAMPADFDKIPKDKPVIIQCTSGQTASQTIAILRLLGYEAYNLSSGMRDGWLAANQPVVTD